MERDKAPQELIFNKKIQIFNEIVGRYSLAAQMGLGSQYGGDRDVYEALGYEKDIYFKDYLKRYLRQDIAKAVIDRPVNATWQGPLDIILPGTSDSPIEKAWKELNKKLEIKGRFNQLDKLTGIGEYGVLLLGVNGVSNAEGFAKPITGRNSELLYVKPYGQGSVEIKTYEDDPKNKRYGWPLMYNLKGLDNATKRSVAIDMHFSRVLHVAGDSLESDVLGAPRLEAIYNRLMDLEKIVGGDAESYWRGARPGYQGIVADDYQLTDPMKEDLQNQLDEFEHKLRRFFMNEGVKLEALEQSIEDPLNHVDIQIQMISAETGIPKRILMGSERGELSSGQDRTEWLSFIKNRRDEYAKPKIVRPFVDRCMELGILPKEEDYEVQWEDVFAPSEKDKVTIGEGRARSLKEYSQNPMAEVILPPTQFLKKILGFSDDEIAEILEARDAEVLKEMKELREALSGTPEELAPPAPAAPGGATPKPKPAAE